MATIREWRNSFVPINRVPLDILSLIPTYLSDQEDRFHASFVCRHWRRTFLQRAELWSQLVLSKGRVYTETLLGRARGSALDVVLDLNLPTKRMALVSPHTRQIRSLSLSNYGWERVQKFSEAVSGPLPLLHTLKIISTVEDRPVRLDTGAPPCPTFFNSAVNLRTFYYHSSSSRSQYLRCFLFPNITSFDFSAETFEELPASQLLDFLEASPVLQTVRMRIAGGMLFDGIPQERVVVLPRVETFTLCIGEGNPYYRLAAHVSCPSAKRTSLAHEGDVNQGIPGETFPGPVVWRTIVHQYTGNPAEEVTLEMNRFIGVACKLTFRSPDATGIDLYFKAKIDEEDEENEEWDQPSVAVHHRVFTQAIDTIRNYQHLAHVKRVRICHDFEYIGFTFAHSIAADIGRLLKSVGPLDELCIYHCDIQPYFYLFLDFPEGYLEEPIVFPPIKELTVMHQPEFLSDGECTTAIAGFAKSQHARGNPLERVIICGECMPGGMEEELRPWVGGVGYFGIKNCEGQLVIEESEDAPRVGGNWCACLHAYKSSRAHVQ